MSIFQQLQQALESGDAFAAIADAMPQFVWTSNSDGTVDYFNRRWVDYTGVTPERVARPRSACGYRSPGRSRRNVAALETLRSPNAFRSKSNIVCAASTVAIAGSSREAEPLRGAGGGVIRWVGTATDVDEQRRLRDSLTFIVETGNIFLSSLDETAICRAPGPT